MTTKTEVP